MTFASLSPLVLAVRRHLARAALISAVVVGSLGLVACGGGGYGYYSPDPVGTFVLGNDDFSFETIEAVEISTFFGPTDYYEVLIFPGDYDEWDLYDDAYDVDVYWSDGRIDHLNVDVYDGLTTTVVLQN